jgi:hypothetical protein
MQRRIGGISMMDFLGKVHEGNRMQAGGSWNLDRWKEESKAG